MGTIHPEFSYYDWIERETRDDFDLCLTEISTDDGETWDPIFQISGTNPDWQRRGPFSLDAYVDEIIRIRFLFDTVDTQFNSFEGWYIDDVLIQERPAETPTPTPYAGESGVDLRLNDDMFYEGDQFLLELDYLNSSLADVESHTYLVLDVYGSYWFWPGWTNDPDYEERTLPMQSITTEEIFDFVWPYYGGNFDDVLIWAAALRPGTQEIIGQYDFVSFGCNR